MKKMKFWKKKNKKHVLTALKRRSKIQQDQMLEIIQIKTHAATKIRTKKQKQNKKR